MNIFGSLLFLHGHVTNAALARQLRDVNRDVAERLDKAIGEIQSLLEPEA